MSKIIRLKILGVRSFDDSEFQTIQFETPLTLIAGQNGAGKTTIIECLRYVTTGVLPPNSKGGAFVHDPRMSAKRDVSAQIKLEFLTASGNEAVVTRSMRATYTKSGSITFKNLDNQLSINDKANTENNRSANSRIADMDAYIPQVLKIPSPILNHVVFCHQEESLWPLAEASVVKKRFDEIFEATKFTKALESLKTTRKEYADALKLQEKTVEHLKQDADRASDMAKQLNEITLRVERYTGECDELKSEIQKDNLELSELFTMNQEFQQVYYQLKQAQVSYDQLSETLTVLQESTEELKDSSDEDLHQQLETMDSREKGLSDQIAQCSAGLKSLETELEAKRNAVSSLNVRQSRIEYELEAREKHSKDLDELTKLDQNFLPKMEKKLEALEQHYEQMTLDHSLEENALQGKVSSAEAAYLQLRQSLAENRASINGLNTDIEKKTRELEKVNRMIAAAPNKRFLEDNLAEQKNKLASISSTHQLETLASELDDLTGELQKKELALESAQKKLKKVSANHSQTLQRNMLRDNLKEKRYECEDLEKKIKNTVTSPYTSILPLTDASQKAMEDLRAEIQKQNKESWDNLTVAKSTKKSLEESIKLLESTALPKLESELSKTQTDLQNRLAIPLDEYPDAIKTAEIELEAATQNLEQSTFVNNYYKAARKLASAEDARCLLCQAHKSKDEAQKLIIIIDGKLKTLPVSPEEAEQQLDEAKTNLETLRNAGSEIEKVGRLKLELENNRVKLEELKKELANQNKVIGTTTEDFDKSSSELSSSDALMEYLSNWSRISLEAKSLESRMETISSSMLDTSSETPEQVQEAVDEALQVARQLRDKKEKVRDSHQAVLSEMSSLEGSINKGMLQLKEAELLEQRAQQEQSSHSDLVRQKEQLEADVKSKEKDYDSHETTINEAKAALRNFKSEALTAESVVATERKELTVSLDKYRELTAFLKEFDAKYGTNPMREVQEEKELLEQQSSKLKEALETQQLEMKRLERTQADFGSHHRQIQDNIQIRKIRGQLEELDLEISSLKRKNSERDKEDYELRTSNLQERIATLNSDMASKMGEIKQLNQQKLDLEHGLCTAYKSTEEDYQRALIEMRNSRTATEDIELYSQALDGAIMKYHSTKMEQINILLDEFWKQTYKGTDIDKIEIKSDLATDARSSYNYRVVMLKQDTELDMRGRCSAGQKVLACIIIRLALSECFGVGCGLLVLDEPTTNLDKENSTALAQSLGNIIASRSNQRNFQLVVITHDTDFLVDMKPSDQCSYYYNVERDSRQLSQVMMEPINNLM